jgi:hypothetical protein
MTIETHAPDRKTLAHALSEAIQEPVRYLGIPSYAYQVGAYTLDRNAAIHGEDFTPLRDFLPQGGYITEDTALTDSRDFAAPTENIAISLPTDTTAQTLTNFLRMVYARQDLLAAMTQSRVLWLDEEVITLLADLKPDSPEKISELLANETAVNMASGLELQDGKLTIAFESPQSEATQELLTRMLDVASQAKRVNAKRITPQDGEMKYYCHTWLMQLHMGGLDFKATRAALLNHLQGYAAFRTADKMDAHKEKQRLLRRTADLETEEDLKDEQD